MDTNRPPQAKQDAPPPGARGHRPVQTGALPGGEPGQGANTSSSAPGQSNVDAAFEQGTEYGKDNLRPR